ncbi:MAG TPA: acetate--CoA ligase family protein [Candidatus Binatia bacterium]|nr:acetate--CoA ligase family protein [Candidatus Binatia bacterium]
MSSNQPLAPLFEADRLAIIGASDRNHYAVNIFKNLQNMGFDPLRIIPINPGRPEVFGLKAYPSIVDVPVEIPLAVIAVNNKAVVSVVEETGRKGVKAGVIFADGFAEGGEAGKKLQQDLTAAAKAANLKLLGPNCMGFVSMGARLGIWGGELPKSLRAGNIGCIFQSSGMMNLLMMAGAKRGLGFHVCASLGNEIVLNSADYLAYQAECPEIDVIATYFEAAPKEPERFAAALDRTIANGKSVLVLRAGKTERAKRNVIAHTGQLAGSAAAWDAFFEQHGAIIVNDLDDLIDTVALFGGAKIRPDKHERGVGLITISGGDCTLLSDIAEQEGVAVPDLSPATQRVLVESLDKPTLLGNPLDVEDLQRINPEAFDRCLEKFFQEPAIDMLGVRLNLPDAITTSAEKLYTQISDLSKSNDKRVFILTRATEPPAAVWYDKLNSLGLTFTGDYRKSLRALSRLRKNERDRAIGRFTPVMRSGPAPARAQLERGVLSYDATDKLLQAYGISLVRSIMAQSAGEAVNAAEKLGYPCVLKISSVDIPHKTEFDALRLGLESREAVKKAYDQMLADVRAKKPDANIEGVLVQKQIKGIECLLGISRDDQIGPTLVMGLGGVFVEILADVVIRIPPITAAEARHALAGLKGAKVFSGVRGAPPADIDALAEMAARLSWLAYDYKGEIAELDLNPVVVLEKGEGAFVVDALLVSRSETT